jgi:hypothetical protein
VCRETKYTLRKSSYKFHQLAFKLATSQLFQKLKSFSPNKQTGP